MKILHVGQMIGGLDVYIRNSIIHNREENEYVIVCGEEDKHLAFAYSLKAACVVMSTRTITGKAF